MWCRAVLSYCRNITEKRKQELEDGVADDSKPTRASTSTAPKLPAAGEKRRNRWDQSGGEG